ncbi:MAG: hypothetical protein ACK59A_14095 [Cyanobacteriota bacterium]|jgi:hypothetical protein
MVLLVLLTLVVVSISHWLFEPLLRLVTPLLFSVWLGWGGLALVLWMFAGVASEGPPSNPNS